MEGKSPRHWWIRAGPLASTSCKDIDIVVEGSGIELAKKLNALNAGKVTVFKNFGTAMFCYRDWEASRRSPASGERGSRKPIGDGTIKDDQNRRDFTINALAISLNEKCPATSSTPSRRRDLENGCIQTPLDPDITFSDDPLRMLGRFDLPPSCTSASPTPTSLPSSEMPTAWRSSAKSGSTPSCTRSS